MKKIEKKIKKESTELIESSLPEISSLDNIQVSPKKAKRLPFYLIPFGAAVAVSAIMIPVLLKQVKPNNTNPIVSTSSSIGGHSSNPTNSSKHVRNTTYTFNFDNYKPVLNNFNEVAYYSYFAFHQGNTTNSNLLQPQRKIMRNEGADGESGAESTKGERYVDEFGRTHYPIPSDMEFVFQDFLYFEFDTVNNPFLTQRIGNGHIYGLSVCTNILNDETMLILKNGEHFYSCLSNGSGPDFIEFSAHKTIDGFDLVKDLTNKRYLTLNFDTTPNNYRDYESLSTIDIEGDVYKINQETLFYDPTPVTCDMDGLKALLGNNPDFEIVDSYGGFDELVFDSASSETNTFTLQEFEGTFSIEEDGLYLNRTRLFNLNNDNKIYASEVNKDAHRDLVFESLEGSTRMFNIYDVYNKEYLYRKQVSKIGEYDYYLGMRDNRVVINLFKPGFIADQYLLDYGYFAYGGNFGATIVWQNLYELAALKVEGAYQADGETPVAFANNYYRFSSNTPYIIEIQLSKFGGSTNPDYPDLEYQIACTPSSNWYFLSMENGVYRYQITFQDKGYSEFKLSFYRFSYTFKAAVDEPVETE